jgi:hypothetical protein
MHDFFTPRLTYAFPFRTYKGHAGRLFFPIE